MFAEAKLDRFRGPGDIWGLLTGGAWRLARRHARLLLLVRFADSARLRRALNLLHFGSGETA
jgi:hypothetical protein